MNEVDFLSLLLPAEVLTDYKRKEDVNFVDM
jgi:hypothetical protein